MADVPVIRPADASDARKIGLIKVRSQQSAYRGKMPPSEHERNLSMTRPDVISRPRALHSPFIASRS